MNSGRFVGRASAVAMFVALAPPVRYLRRKRRAPPPADRCFTCSARRIGLGMIVIGAALGIGKFAAAAAEGIARQPAAVAQITGAVNLPLFLLEGVAILAEVFVLLIVLG